MRDIKATPHPSATPAAASPARPHTGRRRNDSVRRAVLDAVLDLLGRPDHPPLTMEGIASAAGVGRQTIYRWWPSKGAVVLEALAERARADVPQPDSGSLLGDLDVFLAATFALGADPTTAALLRHIVAEALHDPAVADALQRFTAARRRVLRTILARARDRGELPAEADLDLGVDVAYGVFWYSILVGHSPLTPDAARRLAQAVIAVLRVQHEPSTPP
ncbi:TetR/AcrR family transcriptional regulator [Frankia sp. ACN1ag]|uniref:TetR/AcrR family transcriptional regulator n=1 Tax=Frankia sp. ACN1ag TaxID=102891 RepID=UPI00191BD1B4|nr:TetR/AcrR family transcriptional regulator [Frankia sp. ACN1ag]